MSASTFNENGFKTILEKTAFTKITHFSSYMGWKRDDWLCLSIASVGARIVQPVRHKNQTEAISVATLENYLISLLC